MHILSLSASPTLSFSFPPPFIPLLLLSVSLLSFHDICTHRVTVTCMCNIGLIRTIVYAANGSLAFWVFCFTVTRNIYVTFNSPGNEELVIFWTWGWIHNHAQTHITHTKLIMQPSLPCYIHIHPVQPACFFRCFRSSLKNKMFLMVPVLILILFSLSLFCLMPSVWRIRLKPPGKPQPVPNFSYGYA